MSFSCCLFVGCQTKEVWERVLFNGHVLFHVRELNLLFACCNMQYQLIEKEINV